MAAQLPERVHKSDLCSSSVASQRAHEPGFLLVRNRLTVYCNSVLEFRQNFA
jgi:hypothetical protein